MSIGALSSPEAVTTAARRQRAIRRALTWATSQRAHLACVDLMTFTCTPIAVGHPDLPHDAMLALVVSAGRNAPACIVAVVIMANINLLRYICHAGGNGEIVLLDVLTVSTAKAPLAIPMVGVTDAG